MALLIDTIQGFPIAVRVIAYVLLVAWGIEMFLLPFNMSRLANGLSEIKKLLEKSISDSKEQVEALGGKFDITNLVMSDFWKYKHEHDDGKHPSFVVTIPEERKPDA